VIRATQAPVAELVRSGRVRELRGVGPGIAARLSELVETGDIAELQELSTSVKPELVALGRLLGVSTRRMLEIGEVLDVDRRTSSEPSPRPVCCPASPGSAPRPNGSCSTRSHAARSRFGG